MSEGAKRFSMAAILHVTTGGQPGIVDGGPGLEEVQELLSWMTGAPIFIHQIPRAVDVCRKYLCDQYPWLADLHPNDQQLKDTRLIKRWVDRCAKQYGATHLVRALPGGVFHHIDPIVEFLQNIGQDAEAVTSSG